MEKRTLGRSGLEVVPFMLGGNVFGWTADEKESFAVLDAYVEAGGNFIDTADVYSNWVPGNMGGESETILGKWLKARGNRDALIIATKVGWAHKDPKKKGLSRAYIQQAVEESLRRLQTDYIDLYQSHVDDQETPFEETLSTYADLIQQGKVRVIGASNHSAERLAQALRVSQESNLPRYETLQPEYNLVDRAGYESGLMQLAVEQQIGVVPYHSLANGFLSGKYRSPEDLRVSKRGPLVEKYLNERNFRILEALDQVATQYQATPAQVALAWLLSRPGVVAPIASATSVTQLQDLLKATELKLDAAALETLNQASAF
ncbi:aryl-alcohol dehydrogenase-like predicted oxidoreductase [Thermosporothrix hazakensis]|jgi:aryl-alcohol dehydrogenase-like predicted oxidoreductase|uniref:Aryl-alcohol dehydrogenase-like predicted oxidoreductase n=2 Tax=Thermosporothrix TaxID=768650 RepID=A0A326UFP2_THEHA|nr:aldo/keto reductase [Thermosporothrix hazakensis]PZW34514.1 aryl-alcohol dehydrogenase-like predicted oxidoreductase [Thermosporothrix hazakensis]BBH85637.1 oxidoreductase [Thermosporothrix sp. COM3]GCE45934.1 oxidoreductase [Thermosporothrix hazakensis]